MSSNEGRACGLPSQQRQMSALYNEGQLTGMSGRVPAMIISSIWWTPSEVSDAVHTSYFEKKKYKSSNGMRAWNQNWHL
jgi:hypothetical protein